MEGLRYTGHPLVDMGVATILAHVDKDDPEELTEQDLDDFVDYAMDVFFSPAGAKSSMVLFTNNFPATSPRRRGEFPRETFRYRGY